MKKKCTNSACRRVFTPQKDRIVPTCPHCGKIYPRMKNQEQYLVILVGRDLGRSPLAAIKKYRGLTGCKLRIAHKVIRELAQRPVLLARLSPMQAQAEAALWENLGVLVRLVPAT